MTSTPITRWWNIRYWPWDFASWLCHRNIRECRDCMKARVYEEGYQDAQRSKLNTPNTPTTEGETP